MSTLRRNGNQTNRVTKHNITYDFSEPVNDILSSNKISWGETSLKFKLDKIIINPLYSVLQASLVDTINGQLIEMAYDKNE